MTTTALSLAFAAILVAAGVAAAVARTNPLASLVAGQLGFLGAILAAVVLLGVEGRLLAVVATALSGVHGALALALHAARGSDRDADDEERPQW